MKPFEQLVTDHGAAVLRICRVVLGPGPDAEDAWSETFLAALKAYPDLPADANHEAWLVTIARRKAIDIIRVRRRTPVPVPALPDAVSAHGNPGADGGLWQAVLSLPLRQREAVAYHYLAGFPYKEAAELTGSTPAAVRRAAADGIARLRRVLGAAGRLPASPAPEGALR
ncbi:sigma-70 family RNA polymerase sigma factor [Arthrobacter deserti]|uniref:Sigma-70 family RNA polymerase sigma factor n=1 Tax=Arthrobacter deserti TaxID=1742687 RepID=A0ABX1JQZ9_9MICC|nr:sigma-70 family RNA polymerase sigma factor [Arthrobacter deserti]